MPENPNYSNCPSCPEIKRKIDRIELALLGEDGTGLNGGIVHALTQLQKINKVQASWVGVFKPIAVSIISALISSTLTYALINNFN